MPPKKGKFNFSGAPDEAAILPVWNEVRSETGEIYYHNPENNATSWDKPLPGKGVINFLPLEKEKPTPRVLTDIEGVEWQEVYTADGELYYHNLKNDSTSWDRPKLAASATLLSASETTTEVSSFHSRSSDDVEEDDPLDAFMSDIKKELKKKPSASVASSRSDAVSEPAKKKQRVEEHSERFDDDDNDDMDDYMAAWQARQDAGAAAGIDMKVETDEDIRRIAAALDKQNSTNKQEKKRDSEIAMLAAIDHTKIDYIPWEKNIYIEHPDVKSMSQAMLQSINKELDVRWEGRAVPRPCVSFQYFSFHQKLMNAITKQEFVQPTAVQQCAIPVILSGRDLIATAKTGSGKTAAFIWPLIMQLRKQTAAQYNQGPMGLILSPTRELAHQTFVEIKKYTKQEVFRLAAVYGGIGKHEQFKLLKAGCDIVVATPGRLMDLLVMKATNMQRVLYLVLDEADRMFQMGFESQVRSLIGQVRPDRQTLLFSATFPPRIERLCHDVLKDPIRLTVGRRGAANEDIRQVVDVLPSDAAKWPWLLGKIQTFVTTGAVLVFVGQKISCEELVKNIQAINITCAAIHGDKQQAERQDTFYQFKKNEIQVLVATDIAARGLDIKGLKTVICYDKARTWDDHIHRIGRTGRAGEDGVAYTLVTNKEAEFAGQLVNMLDEGGLVVPPELLQLAHTMRSFYRIKMQTNYNTNIPSGMSGMSSAPLVYGAPTAANPARPAYRPRTDIDDDGFDFDSGGYGGSGSRGGRGGSRGGSRGGRGGGSYGMVAPPSATQMAASANRSMNEKTLLKQRIQDNIIRQQQGLPPLSLDITDIRNEHAKQQALADALMNQTSVNQSSAQNATSCHSNLASSSTVYDPYNSVPVLPKVDISMESGDDAYRRRMAMSAAASAVAQINSKLATGTNSSVSTSNLNYTPYQSQTSSSSYTKAAYSPAALSKQFHGSFVGGGSDINQITSNVLPASIVQENKAGTGDDGAAVKRKSRWG